MILASWMSVSTFDGQHRNDLHSEGSKMKNAIGLMTLCIACVAPTANAVVYCTGPGIPVGCVVRPVVVPGVVAPGVGAPGVGAVDPGINQPGAAGNVGMPRPGVGAPGAGAVDPGINQPGAAGNVGNPVNRGGPANRAGPR